MKKILFVGIFILLTSCFKDYEEKFNFRDYIVEFQDAVVVSHAVGKTYPIISVRPGDHSLQVNLLGGLSENVQIVRAKVIAEETTAVAGEHYQLTQDGQVHFTAGAAISTLNYVVPTLTPRTDVTLVLQLEPNDQVKTSANYKTVGLRIRN